MCICGAEIVAANPISIGLSEYAVDFSVKSPLSTCE